MSKLLSIHNYVEMVKQGTPICPECRAEDCEGGNVNVVDAEAQQEMVCGNCGFEWTDIYELKRYQP